MPEAWDSSRGERYRGRREDFVTTLGISDKGDTPTGATPSGAIAFTGEGGAATRSKERVVLKVGCALEAMCTSSCEMDPYCEMDPLSTFRPLFPCFLSRVKG